MSLFQEVETTNYNIFEDLSNSNEGNNSMSNESDYINIDLKEEENNNNSILSNNEKKQDIDNDKFLEFFMNIDYTTDFLNDFSAKEFSNTINQTNNDKIEKNIILKKENDISTQSQLTKKTQREKDNGILYDELTNITYIEKEDPIAFRKAKKRIQNRESALRMKKLKQMNSIKNENEIDFLKKENNNLKIE